MITGVHKEKCPHCGHEFIVMEGDLIYNPNSIMHCPECGTVIITSSSSVVRKLRDIIFRRQ